MFTAKAPVVATVLIEEDPEPAEGIAAVASVVADAPIDSMPIGGARTSPRPSLLATPAWGRGMGRGLPTDVPRLASKD